MSRVLAAVLGLLALSAAAAPASAQEFDPAFELQQYSMTQQRHVRDLADLGFQAKLRTESVEGEVAFVQLIAADPERNPLVQLCSHANDGCAGDVRLYDWGANGHGIVKPVLFTARNGSTLSGHVWMSKTGPARRPGVVITNGSVQAPEELYLFAATTLAKAGFVVMTWDPQGQGKSDTFGDGPDRLDGVPSQEGRPFYDGTEDALDFFFSTPAKPYDPRPSCTSGTDHSAKQDRRVKAGLNAGFNPLHETLDTSRVGLAGHSLGAGAVSYVGQLDPRVKAIVAWDNLRDASSGGGPECATAPATRPAKVALTKPALGMSADYGLVATPHTSLPDPQGKNTASRAYTKAGVDTAQLNIRGGTHFEFSYIPNPAFGASLRGMDMTAWYTVAWMDKYVKGDPSADARLLTNRWHDDAAGKKVDPFGDGNLFSVYLRSRIDITRAGSGAGGGAARAGGRSAARGAGSAGEGAARAGAGGGKVTCEDVRTGCGVLASDGLPPNYDYLADATGPDDPAFTPPAATSPRRCTSRRVIVITLPKGTRSSRATIGGRRAATGKGRKIKVSFVGRPKGPVTVRIKARRPDGKTRTVVRRFHLCGKR